MLPVTSGARSLSWMLRGACRQADLELFFPGPGVRRAEAAKAVCGRCAVRANCLSYALETMPEGIWGGTTKEERQTARRSSGRRVRGYSRGTAGAAVAGEPAAVTRHAPGQWVTSGRTAR